jgi:hypothetical protein
MNRDQMSRVSFYKVFMKLSKYLLRSLDKHCADDLPSGDKTEKPAADEVVNIWT